MNMVYTHNRRMARPGFTFIELVIAIAILAILGALVGPALLRYVGRAKETNATANVQTMKVAIENFQADTGKFPMRLSELTYKPMDPKIARKWHGPYLEKEIQEDPWGNEYQYRVNPPGATPPYELYSFGPLGEGSPRESWINVWNL